MKYQSLFGWKIRKQYHQFVTLGKLLSKAGMNYFFFFFFFFFFFLFSYFSQKTGFDISCKLSPWETICMKYQSMFLDKKNQKKKITNLSLLVKFFPDDILK